MTALGLFQLFLCFSCFTFFSPQLGPRFPQLGEDSPPTWGRFPVWLIFFTTCGCFKPIFFVDFQLGGLTPVPCHSPSIVRWPNLKMWRFQVRPLNPARVPRKCTIDVDDEMGMKLIFAGRTYQNGRQIRHGWSWDPDVLIKGGGIGKVTLACHVCKETSSFRWWCHIFFVFHPENWGRFPPIFTNSFQMGWFHQLDFLQRFIGLDCFFWWGWIASPRKV